MVERKNISDGTSWEPLIGYSRAVKIDNQIYISSTAAIDKEGQIVGGNSAYEQTRYIIERIKSVLKEAGASLEDVVRTRMYVRNIGQWKEYARAHREAFQDIRPANTFIEISSSVDPRMLVEIEAEAVISNSGKLEKQ
ncbi:MAG: RidA family protein [Bdellovibrionota bacterium]